MSLETEISVFQSSLPIEAKLERAREELLDLSARNRLLNMPRSSKSAKSIEIVDEKVDEIFRLFVNEGRAFTFLAGKLDREASEGFEEIDENELAQPTDDVDGSERIARRYSDTKFQTRMTPTGLQKRLLDLIMTPGHWKKSRASTSSSWRSAHSNGLTRTTKRTFVTRRSFWCL